MVVINKQFISLVKNYMNHEGSWSKEHGPMSISRWDILSSDKTTNVNINLPFCWKGGKAIHYQVETSPGKKELESTRLGKRSLWPWDLSHPVLETCRHKTNFKYLHLHVTHVNTLNQGVIHTPTWSLYENNIA